MKKRMYLLHIFRSVKDSMGRFFAIFGIVLLGVGFMAGMLSSAPDMRISADAYFDEYNLYDIRVVGTLGITEDDIVTMKKTDGVRGVMPGYTADAIVDSDTGLTQVVRVSTLPFSLLFAENESYVNQIKLVSGRTPETAEEAVLIRNRTYLDSYKIGDRLTFSSDNEDLSETFSVNGFTVVGVAESPCHFSIDKQSTDVGSGTVGANFLVGTDSFSMDCYTEAYVTVEGSKELNSFEDAYDRKVADIAESITGISDLRCQVRQKEVRDQLKEAKRELTANKKELYTAKGKLSSAAGQIDMLEETVPQLEKALAQGRDQYEEGLELYDEKMEEAKSALDSAKAALTQVNMLIAVADKTILSAKEELEQMRQAGNEEQAAFLEEQLDNLLVYYDGLLERLDEANRQYEEGLALYKAAKKEADSQLSDAEAMIVSYEQQVKETKDQLATAKKEYAAGLAAYEEQEKTALPLFEEAEEKIADMELMLEKVGMPEWYVLTRQDDMGFAGFSDNTDRIEAIGRVFPVFFFLVAALVSLTTMARMIDEERTQIGTMKALGYSRKAIMGKYILYAETATLGGSVVGILIGIYLLPRVIWNTYGMMYMLPEAQTPFHAGYCLTAMGVAALCTLLVTWGTCRATLREVPARLMLPKPPKAGKKIFLEHIGFLWRRLPFVQKVTARNLLRYKKRFFMTVCGIAGCTALLLTGFGLKDSISDILDKQFKELHTYDAMVALKDNDNLSELKSYLDENNLPYLLNYQATVTVQAGDKKQEENLYVTENAEKMPAFVVLRDRKTQTAVSLDDSGVVLTEKLAANLGVSAGDRVTLLLDGKEIQQSVIGIAENYVNGYVYMTKTAYETAYGNLRKYNLIDVLLPDEQKSAITTALLQNDSVALVTSVDDIMKSFSTMLDKVNVIVWVLILAAAMLAFVVLYNLTNINITERRREIATLKVLGFYNKETYTYIFRETAILTLVGTAVGLVAGIFLWMFVVKTAEVDMVMFGREIYPWSYGISAVLTAVFSAIIFLIMTPKLRNIDMVESLKSGE